jgi:tetratricopeptide (TPR) repeat protein
MMRQVAPAWHAQLHPSSGDGATAAALTAGVQAGSAEQMKRQLVVLLTELARSKPLVLFLDDVHWADASTVDLIAYLGSRFDSLHMLLIVAYRPSDLLLAKHPLIEVAQTLRSRGVWRETRLGGFTRADLEQFMASAYPQHDFPAEAIDLIHERTEGMPLFVADLMRRLADRGIVTNDETGWHLTQSLVSLESELPDSVRGFIQRTIERLDDADRRLLVAASVQGAEFDSAVLAKCLGMDSGDVEERLERLEGVHALVRFLDERELARRTPSLRYAFAHIFYQNALHATLRATRRATLSLAVAQALADYYGSVPAIVPQLALLYETARQFDAAATAFLLAAQNAVRLFANKEAVSLARRGLDAVSALPATPERDRLELQLQVTLGVPLTALRGYAAPEVEQAYSRARALCSTLDDTPSLRPVLHGLYRFYVVRGQLQTADEIVRQLVVVSQNASDPDQLLVAQAAMGSQLVHSTRLEEAVECLSVIADQTDTEAAARWSQRQYLSYGPAPAVTARVWLARAEWLRGRPQRALEVSAAALDLAARGTDAFALAYAHGVTAMLYQHCGDASLVQHHADVTLQIAREHDFAQWLALGMILRPWAIAVLGDAGQGRAALEQAITRYRRAGAELNLPYFLSLLADVHLRTGNRPAGLETVQEALRVAHSNLDTSWEPELHRIRGELILMPGLPSPDSNLRALAEEAFREAFAVAARQGSRSLQLRASVSLARLLLGAGRAAEAHESLEGVAAMFPAGMPTPELVAARELLGGETSDSAVHANS